jgi:phospholipid-translocating ATPase
MHYKTWISALGWFLSVGGWTLWNVILSAIYSNQNSTVYAVRAGFLKHFGGSGKWWLVVICIIDSVIIYEIAMQAIKKTWWPSDVDVWQVLEKDKIIKRRLVEAAAGEVAGMDSGTGISQEGGKATAEDDDERDIEDLINHPRAMMTPLTTIITAASTEGGVHETHSRQHSSDVISPREI